MSVELGTDEYTYRLEEGWGVLPDGWELGDVAAVSVDAKDNVYVFNRGPHPMIVFNATGEVIDSWGEGIFTHPHGTFVAPDQTIFCTDDREHTVRRCTLSGQVLLTLGTPGTPSGEQSGIPFNRCTHTAMSPDGDIYVSDGYRNARVHMYSPEGRLVLSWGAPGSDRGQFNVPHNICCDDAGWVYVADRENHRIQVFDRVGNYQEQWNNLHRPSALCMSLGSDPVAYVGEMGPYLRTNRTWPNLGPRISVLSAQGELLGRLADVPSAGAGPTQFTSPHGIAVDSRGDLYIGEVAYTGWSSLFPDVPPPENLRRLRKLVKIGQPQGPEITAGRSDDKESR